MKKRKPVKRWTVRSIKDAIMKGRIPYQIKGKKITRRELTTLQIVQMSQTRGTYIQNIGRGLQKDITTLKKRGLVSWHKKEPLRKGMEASAYAGLALTAMGFQVLAASTMMGFGTRIFAIARER